MRRALLASALAAALSLGCNAANDVECTASERLVCIGADNCRCGARCVPNASATTPPCPRSDAGVLVCAPLTDTPGAGACVDLSWVTGSPAGMVRCGAELCPATVQCVDWGRVGVRCAQPCARNADCRSGCCSVVSDPATRRTFNVCAPTSEFRCMSGSPAGQLCEPACGADAVCLATRAGPRCTQRCTGDTPGECPGSCCASLEGGGRACAPAGTACSAPIAPACGVLDECVMVTYSARGDHCGGSPDSVEVRVRNGCTRAADVKICFERRDGTCTCGVHTRVAPNTSPSPAFWACDLTGRFRVLARAAGDAPGCMPDQCQ